MTELARDKIKLKSKDLIVSGAFAALYIVLMFMSVSLLGFIPVLYLTAPFVLAIILGPVFMLYVTKVPKRGAILILAVLIGLLTSMGGVWQAGLWAVLCGLVAELIAASGKYSSKRAYFFSYIMIALTNMGPFWLLVFAKGFFLETCVQYYGMEYAATLDALTPEWFILVLIGLSLLGGVIGGLFGQKLIAKHFKKAGLV